MKKLLLLSALLIFACSSDSEGNDCIYEPTLSTEAVTDITETSATLNGVISIVSENCEVALGGMQGFVYSTNPSPTNYDNVEVVYGTDISASIEGLEPETTYYVRVFITNSLGEFYGNEVEFNTTEEVCDVVYLDENGVTIKACESANIGDVGTINGVEYTVANREMLDQMLLNEEDVTKICTTRITDLSYMTTNPTNWIPYPFTPYFNQDISSWDTSSVTNMEHMFSSSIAFNQPIGDWDTSSVTNMEHMFSESYAFNQPIGDWGVSSVTNMRYMFGGAESFNQDISDWDVSSVTDMEYMFTSSIAFNQPIGDWDTSNVTNMWGMFSGCLGFNQPIGDWDVSSVTNMQDMFSSSIAFNQPIGDWDTSDVTDMGGMFFGADSFNQPIGDWDVSSVTFMRRMFGDIDYSTSFNQPIGDWDVSNVTDMYRMFYGAPAFNQDLSAWSAENVISCAQFSQGASSWTLPQPNFTNCNPN